MKSTTRGTLAAVITCVAAAAGAAATPAAAVGTVPVPLPLGGAEKMRARRGGTAWPSRASAVSGRRALQPSAVVA
ncbi:hypothetical protein ACFZDB_26180, partial [Streptomyces luteogriseus]